MAYLAIARVGMGLGSFSYVVNNGKESVSIDFFGSDLLPVQNVLS